MGQTKILLAVPYPLLSAVWFPPPAYLAVRVDAQLPLAYKGSFQVRPTSMAAAHILLIVLRRDVHGESEALHCWNDDVEAAGGLM